MSQPQQNPPTLYDWASGLPALHRLMDLCYTKVLADPTIGPVFQHMSPDHPPRVAHFIGEVLGGPPTYAETFGEHAHMLSHHLNRALSESQRRRWMTLLMDTLDEAGLPQDPEFRSSFLAYIEWGTRIAVINSQPGVQPQLDQPMPRWGWGETKGPYQP